MAQTCIVTGANRGIGLELARQLSARGDTVIGTARNPDSAADRNKLGIQVETLDVTNPKSIAALAKKLKGVPVDLLVHNAAVGVAGPAVEKVTAEEIDFRADGPVTVNAAPTTTVDDLAVTSDFSDVFFLNATLISADDVEISAGGDIHLDDETVDAQDGVKVSAGANALASNVGITAGDDVEIEALTGDINIPGANFEVTVDTGAPGNATVTATGCARTP